MSTPRERLIVILDALTKKELVSPGDIASETGLPRYMVLAAFQCLEALGVIEMVYSKGNHKLYAARPVASELLKLLKEGVEAPALAIIRRQVEGEATANAA
ncbi:MAG: hypothetical protein ABWW69_06100 [Pyrodictiaceae archaeon]